MKTVITQKILLILFVFVWGIASAQDFQLSVTTGNQYTSLNSVAPLVTSFDANTVTSANFGAALNWFGREYKFDGTPLNGPYIGGPGYLTITEYKDSTTIVFDPLYTATMKSKDNTSSIRAAISGSAPNRILIVEWQNAGFTKGDTLKNFANFQIWLHESEPVMEVHIGKNNIVDPVFNDGTSLGPRIGFWLTDNRASGGGKTTRSVFLSGSSQSPQLVQQNKDDVSSLLSSMPAEGTVYKFSLKSQTGLAQDVTSANGNLNAYPNPGNGLLTLNLPSGCKEEGSVKLLDMQGRVIKDKYYSGLSETHQIQFDASDALPGMYILILTQEQKVFTQKIVIK